MSAEQVAVGFADVQRQPLDDKMEFAGTGLGPPMSVVTMGSSSGSG